MTPYYDDDTCVIYNADCLTMIGSLTFDVVVTDPPYGMAFRSGMGGAFGDSRIEGDDTLDARDQALALCGGKPAIVFGRWSLPKPAGTKAVLTWEKGNHVGMGDLSLPWKPNTEEIYVIGSGFCGDRRGSSVIKEHAIAGTVGRADMGTRHHPTEKPVGLMRHLVDRCPPGVILDPFMGSGTTLRAAKDCGRKAIGIELNEAYCEIAAKRLAQEVLAL